MATPQADRNRMARSGARSSRTFGGLLHSRAMIGWWLECEDVQSINALAVAHLGSKSRRGGSGPVAPDTYACHWSGENVAGPTSIEKWRKRNAAIAEVADCPLFYAVDGRAVDLKAAVAGDELFLLSRRSLHTYPQAFDFHDADERLAATGSWVAVTYFLGRVMWNMGPSEDPDAEAGDLAGTSDGAMDAIDLLVGSLALLAARPCGRAVAPLLLAWLRRSVADSLVSSEGLRFDMRSYNLESQIERGQNLTRAQVKSSKHEIKLPSSVKDGCSASSIVCESRWLEVPAETLAFLAQARPRYTRARPRAKWRRGLSPLETVQGLKPRGVELVLAALGDHALPEAPMARSASSADAVVSRNLQALL